MIEKKLPEGWEWERIRNFVKKVDSIDPTRSPTKRFCYIDIDSIDSSNQTIQNPKLITGKEAPSRARQIIKKDDILFSTVRPYLKNIALIDEIYDSQVASTGFCVIRVTEGVDNKYLFYYLKSDAFLSKLKRYYRGANSTAISDSDLLRQQFTLPPLDTQRKIVAILEKAEATQRLRAEADALMQQQSISLFNNMFGDPVSNRMKWEVRKLGELATIKDVDHKMPIGVEEGIYYISTKDFHSLDSIDFSGAKKISEHDFQQLSKKIEPKYGDIIYSRYGTIGEVRLVPKDVKFQISYSLCIIRLEKDVIKLKFLYYLLKNPNFLRYALSKKRSSAIPDLGLNEIKQFNIIVPPLPLQQEFLNSIKKYEILLQSQKLSASQIELMNASLFNRAFNGKLVV